MVTFFSISSRSLSLLSLCLYIIDLCLWSSISIPLSQSSRSLLPFLYVFLPCFLCFLSKLSLYLCVFNPYGSFVSYRLSFSGKSYWTSHYHRVILRLVLRLVSAVATSPHISSILPPQASGQSQFSLKSHALTRIRNCIFAIQCKCCAASHLVHSHVGVSHSKEISHTQGSELQAAPQGDARQAGQAGQAD